MKTNTLHNALHVVFDLDDTLYAELDYVKSSFAFLAGIISNSYGSGDCENLVTELLELRRLGLSNPISALWDRLKLPESGLPEAVAAMRGHRPQIEPRDGVIDFLNILRQADVKYSILTDGRSLTQRQKIAALGLGDAAHIYISAERGVSKPAIEAFAQIVQDQPSIEKFVYVADNPSKDFVAPNQMDWLTIMLKDDGHHIHKQDLSLPMPMLPRISVKSFKELPQIFGFASTLFPGSQDASGTAASAP